MQKRNLWNLINFSKIRKPMEYHRSAGAYPHQDACLTQANIDDLWTDIDCRWHVR